uniref:Uncharacterized protein n=1 Tax=Candidatus Methanomethylicus mesodigestus TaxID=1867258 RepID=A0A7C3EVV6_9CREN
MASRILKFEAGLLIWLAAAAACGGTLVSMAIDLSSKIGAPSNASESRQSGTVVLNGAGDPVSEDNGVGRR